MDIEGTTILSIRRKIVFIGNPSAGKTSLLNRICNDKFMPDYDSTIGVDFFTKTIYYNESIFKVQLWDSAGQEKYRSLIPSYVRGASIVFLIYDLSWRESFDAIKNWLGFVNQFASKDQIKLVLVGNKSDLERKVKTEEGKKLADKEGNPELNMILNRKFCCLFEEYLNSEEFGIDEINRLKNTENKNDDYYIEKYVYLAKHFIEFCTQ